MTELISVIMSVYNEKESDLKESIESILNQTYSEIELIIVNDNPDNPDLKRILESYRDMDSRVRIINNDSNIGLARSLNEALQVATGEFVARMDADDISVNNRLELQYNYLKSHSDCDLVSSNRVDIDEDSKLIGTDTRFHITDEHIKEVIRYGTVIIHPTVMARKKLFEEMQGYNNFRAAQDYDLWLRILGNGHKIHIMEEQLLKYRMRSDSITKGNFYRQYLYSKLALERQKLRETTGDKTMIYSQEEIDDFLNRNKLNDKEYVRRFNDVYWSIHSIISKKSILDLLSLVPQVLRLPEMKNVLIKEYRFKKALKKYSGG